MKLGKKERRIRNDNTFLKSFSRIASPVCNVLFYVSIVLVAVIGIVALILLMVHNVSPHDMLLPPFMRQAGGSYTVSLGNGVMITTDSGYVTLGSIKTALYCWMAMLAGVLIVLIPIFRFLSGLLDNVAKSELFKLDNARYMKKIGWTILVGNTAVLFINRFFNYKLMKTFLNLPLYDGNYKLPGISFEAGPDTVGIVMGLLVLLLAAIYGYACRMHSGGLDAISTENSVVPVEKNTQDK